MVRKMVRAANEFCPAVAAEQKDVTSLKSSFYSLQVYHVTSWQSHVRASQELYALCGQICF